VVYFFVSAYTDLWGMGAYRPTE